MLPTEGASVAESPYVNPGSAPVAIAQPAPETQAVSVPVPATELGTFMIPGDPDSYSLGPTAAATTEAPPTMVMEGQVMNTPVDSAEPVPASFDAISAPSTPGVPEAAGAPAAPSFTENKPLITRTSPAATPPSEKVNVTIEHTSKPRNEVREIRPATAAVVLGEKMTTHFPAELEALVGLNVEKVEKAPAVKVEK